MGTNPDQQFTRVSNSQGFHHRFPALNSFHYHAMKLWRQNPTSRDF